MAKKRGSPNWGKPEVNSVPYTGTNSFEEVVKKLPLSPSQYEGSISESVRSVLRYRPPARLSGRVLGPRRGFFVSDECTDPRVHNLRTT